MKPSLRRRTSLWLVLVATTASACAGARVNVTANRAAYPISMSGYVRDNTGRLYERRELQTVGQFVSDGSRVGFLYSLLTPSSYDVSDEVNAQVAAANGEAVVNLNVAVTEGCAVLNEFPVLNALPIWPGCVPLIVTGNIVRRRPLPPALPRDAPGAAL